MFHKSLVGALSPYHHSKCTQKSTFVFFCCVFVVFVWLVIGAHLKSREEICFSAVLLFFFFSGLILIG